MVRTSDMIRTSEIYDIEHIKTALDPIFTRYGIETAYIFGSYARNEAEPDSDIDIVIRRGKIKNLFELGGLFEEIRQTLMKEIDLVTEESFTDYDTDELTREFYSEMLKERVKIYG